LQAAKPTKNRVCQLSGTVGLKATDMRLRNLQLTAAFGF
jgi:hypothetical protein